MQVRKIKQLMDEATIMATIAEMVEQVITEFQSELANLQFMGIVTHGLPIAQKAADIFEQKTGKTVLVSPLLIKIYNDDLSHARPVGELLKNPKNFKGKILIIWDDVAWTLATLEKAFTIITTNSKPQKIIFAVLVNRIGCHAPDKAAFAPQAATLKAKRVLSRNSKP
mgnify:CR=1 FL=1